MIYNYADTICTYAATRLYICCNCVRIHVIYKSIVVDRIASPDHCLNHSSVLTTLIYISCRLTRVAIVWLHNSLAPLGYIFSCHGSNRRHMQPSFWYLWINKELTGSKNSLATDAFLLAYWSKNALHRVRSMFQKSPDLVTWYSICQENKISHLSDILIMRPYNKVGILFRPKRLDIRLLNNVFITLLLRKVNSILFCLELTQPWYEQRLDFA